VQAGAAGENAALMHMFFCLKLQLVNATSCFGPGDHFWPGGSMSFEPVVEASPIPVLLVPRLVLIFDVKD